MAMIAEGQIAYHVLMLIGSAGPVAMYFLWLGLVNCQAQPCLVSARSDFIALSVVLAPIFLWCVPVAIQFRSGWMLGLAVLLLAFVFRKLLPDLKDGFVIYNVSRRVGLGRIDDALRNGAERFNRLSDSEWVSIDGDLSLRASSFVLLRSVSIQIVGESQRTSELAGQLRNELERRLGTVEQLPSATGAGLVFAGVSIAVVPMWLVTRHIQELVEAVASLFG